MPNTFDTIPQALTARAIANNFSLEEKGRREAALLNRKFYYGQQEEELILVNDDIDAKILNLIKPIVKKRTSLLYKKELQREFKGPAQSISFLEQTYLDNSIDSLLLQCDLLSDLTGSCLIHPEQVEENEDYPSGIKLRLYDASCVSIIPEDNDQSKADAISLISLVDRLAETSTDKNPQVERLIRQQIWTKNSVTTYDGSMIVATESNDFGFLPFVNFEGEVVHDQYLGHAPGTIVRKLNSVINQMLTDLGYMIKMQAATPVALVGFSSGDGVVIHPGTAFSIPAGGEAKALDLDPKIEECLEVIKYLEEKIYETSSVPKITIVGGEGQSGRELLIRWFPILQVFQEKVVRFEKKELKLANMILKVQGLPEIEEVLVNYPEEDLLPLSTSDETLERDIKLNIKTPIDEIMRQNPEMTEEEANAELLANKDVNHAILDIDDENEEDKEVEDEGKEDVRE